MQEQKVNKMDYEKEIEVMKKALSQNVECGYIKNFVRHDILSDGRTVRVQLLIEIETGDPLE